MTTQSRRLFLSALGAALVGRPSLTHASEPSSPKPAADVDACFHLIRHPIIGRSGPRGERRLPHPSPEVDLYSWECATCDRRWGLSDFGRKHPFRETYGKTWDFYRCSMARRLCVVDTRVWTDLGEGFKERRHYICPYCDRCWSDSTLQKFHSEWVSWMEARKWRRS